MVDVQTNLHILENLVVEAHAFVYLPAFGNIFSNPQNVLRTACGVENWHFAGVQYSHTFVASLDPVFPYVFNTKLVAIAGQYFPVLSGENISLFFWVNIVVIFADRLLTGNTCYRFSRFIPQHKFQRRSIFSKNSHRQIFYYGIEKPFS